MGADGGVCWVQLREPLTESAERLRRLLPWPLLTFDDYHPSNSEFDQTLGAEFFTGTYGTSQEYSLLDLGDILDYLSDAALYPEYRRTMTLREVLEDCYTKPEVYGRHDLDPFERVLAYTYLGWHWSSGFSYLGPSLERGHHYRCAPQEVPGDERLGMTVEQWEAQVRSCLRYKHPVFLHEETWT